MKTRGLFLHVCTTQGVSEFCPVWIVEGAIDTVRVLLCIDNSENALRAVDHAGFMLSGTDCRVTLFHSMRHLRHFLPLEVLEDASDLDKLWKEKAGKQIAPYLKRAREMFLNAGLSDDQIANKVADGTRIEMGAQCVDGNGY